MPPRAEDSRLRTIPAEFAPDVVAAVDADLDRIVREEGVRIAWAIESGSRAWGFPSPDSDYDCRFLFVRPTQDHLTPWPKRDVIETPLIGDLDINGWELGKALRLLLKGNAVVIEWLTSPIIYRGEPWFRDELLALAAQFADRALIGRHYLHLGERQRRNHFGDGKSVKQKKIFYALRPAAALRWLRLHPAAAVPPMHFPTLMAECDPPSDVTAETHRLMEIKRATRELGEAPLPSPVAAFLDAEFEEARRLFDTATVQLPPEARAAAEALFRRVTSRFETGG